MPLDPSIILAGKPAQIPTYYENQLNQSKIADALQNQKVNQLKIDEYNRGLETNKKLSDIYSKYSGNNSELSANLMRAGSAEDAIKVGNYGAEQTTKGLANTKSSNEIMGQVAGSVLQLPDEKIHDASMQGIDYLQKALPDIYTPEFADQARQHTSAMQPQDLRLFLQQMQTQALSAKDQIPKTGIQNLGGTDQAYSQDIFGKVTNVGDPMQKTLTPDQINDNKRQEEQGRLNREVQMRGQDINGSKIQATSDRLMTANTSGLRKEFNDQPEVMNYNVIQPLVLSAREAAKDTSGASDLNLIYAVGKAFDPTSVVREGELTLAADTGSFGEKLKGYYKKVAEGGKLTPNVKADLLKQVESRASNQEKMYKKTRDTYEGIAKRSGMNPSDIFIDQLVSYDSAPNVGSTQTPIPSAAIDMLKKNPSMRSHFDQKYGAGSAAKVLGK